jgi:hypothetical protein
MSDLREEDKRSLREVLAVYKKRRETQLYELSVIDFMIAHLREEWRKENPWEYEQDAANSTEAES